ncbi:MULTISPECIES: hypothetical protein [Streptomyces]
MRKHAITRKRTLRVAVVTGLAGVPMVLGSSAFAAEQPTPSPVEQPDQGSILDGIYEPPTDEQNLTEFDEQREQYEKDKGAEKGEGDGVDKGNVEKPSHDKTPKPKPSKEDKIAAGLAKAQNKLYKQGATKIDVKDGLPVFAFNAQAVTGEFYTWGEPDSDGMVAVLYKGRVIGWMVPNVNTVETSKPVVPPTTPEPGDNVKDQEEHEKDKETGKPVVDEGGKDKDNGGIVKPTDETTKPTGEETGDKDKTTVTKDECDCLTPSDEHYDDCKTLGGKGKDTPANKGTVTVSEQTKAKPVNVQAPKASMVEPVADMETKASDGVQLAHTGGDANTAVAAGAAAVTLALGTASVMYGSRRRQSAADKI